MKEFEVGDVIPIYEVDMSLVFQLVKSDTRPQQRPQDIGYNNPGLIKVDNLTINKGTDFEHSDYCYLFEEEVKPIGQMRIKKLK